MKIWEKYKNIIIILIAVVALILLGGIAGTMVTTLDKIAEMENQLMYLIDTNSILQSQVSNLQGNIEAALEEEGSLIEQHNIEVINTDFATGTYEVKISVTPKEYSDATKVSVFFGANEIPLTLNRYSYEGTAKLSLNTNYDGNVTFLFVNGDKKSTEILKDYQGLQSKLADLLYGSIPEIPKYRDGKIYLSDFVDYTLNSYESYGYESLELVVMTDEEEIGTLNLLEDISKQKEDTEQQDEVKQELTYGASGTTSIDVSYEVKEGQNIRIFLRAKCENGYRFEYDLFQAVVEAEGPNGYAETEDYFLPNYTIFDEHGNQYKLK